MATSISHSFFHGNVQLANELNLQQKVKETIFQCGKMYFSSLSLGSHLYIPVHYPLAEVLK